MSNAYASLDVFKASGVLNITGTDDDARLLALLEDVSRQIDRFCLRHFYSLTATRYFQGRKTSRLPFRSNVYWDNQRIPFWFGVGIGASEKVLLPDDLIAVSTLKEDVNADGTYSNTWATTDYFLWPYDADPADGYDLSRPYTMIEVNKRGDGDYFVFLYNQQAYQLTGRWGYSEQITDTGVTTNGVLTASDTTVTVSSGTTIFVGETLRVESEQMYVTGKATNDLTVVRGVNGTTAATHVTASMVERYSYPGPIVEACLMQSARLWTRRQSGFANVVGFTETGQMTPMTGLDTDVKDLLKTYRKIRMKMRVL